MTKRLRALPGLAAAACLLLPAGAAVAGSSPVAHDDSITISDSAASASIDPRSNDSDADGDTLSIAGKTDGERGAVSITGGGTGLTYTRTKGGPATDAFSYSLSDGHGGVDTAVVTVTITHAAPVAAADAITTHVGGFVDFNPLANDTIYGGDYAALTASTNGSKGLSLVMGPGTLRYVPSGTTGSDSFTYTITDADGSTATGTVNVTIAANSAPTAVNDSYTVQSGGSDTLHVTSNDTDPNGDALHLAAAASASHGTVTLFPPDAPTTIIYTPSPGYSGSDSFTYTVQDSAGATSTATVSITVSPN